jgi:hypothetical protein
MQKSNKICRVELVAMHVPTGNCVENLDEQGLVEWVSIISDTELCGFYIRTRARYDTHSSTTNEKLKMQNEVAQYEIAERWGSRTRSRFPNGVRMVDVLECSNIIDHIKRAYNLDTVFACTQEFIIKIKEAGMLEVKNILEEEEEGYDTHEEYVEAAKEHTTLRFRQRKFIERAFKRLPPKSRKIIPREVRRLCDVGYDQYGQVLDTLMMIKGVEVDGHLQLDKHPSKKGIYFPSWESDYYGQIDVRADLALTFHGLVMYAKMHHMNELGALAIMNALVWIRLDGGLDDSSFSVESG